MKHGPKAVLCPFPLDDCPFPLPLLDLKDPLDGPLKGWLVPLTPDESK